MLRPRSVLLLVASLQFAAPALADWPAGGKRVVLTHDSFNGVRMVRCLDLPSGDVSVVSVGVGGNSFGYSGQRITPTGEIASGWPADGIIFGEVSKSFSPTQNGFAVDDSGCVWHAAWGMVSNRASAQFVNPGGGLLPGSFAAWATTTGPTSTGPVDVALAPGGAYVVWASRIQRLTRSGAIAAGWPGTGLSLGFSPFETAVMPDGAGGAVVLGILGTPTVQHMDANAVRHAGWPAGGLVLSNDPADALADFDPSRLDPLVPSGPDHFIAGWSTPYDSEVKSVRLQRFSLDGTIDPAWPAGGLLAVAPDTLTGVTFLPDGERGIHVLWYAHGRAWGKHVLADGGLPAGMTGDPVDLAGGAPGFIIPNGSLGPPSSPMPYVVAGPASGGRLLFAFQDASTLPVRSFRVRWLLRDYAPDPSEPVAGRLVVPDANDRVRAVAAVHADPVGGAYLAWESIGTDPIPFADIGEIWMTRILPSTLVGVSPQRHAALALSAPRPNPARGSISLDVTLPDDSPARVELLDVAGRVLRAQLVHGAGAHAIAFADLATLTPGLYFARVSHPLGSETSRVVVAR